jgi:hypothetical protein
MKGRGTRLIVLAATFCLVAVSGVEAAPARSLETAPSAVFNRLCQDRPEEKIDYHQYFTAPEREGMTIYVFYNNIIDPNDDKQFGYALVYGLELTAEAAKEKDILAVGIYFSDNKGKIYCIEKAKFMKFQNMNLPIDQLLNYMKIQEVNTGR